MYTEIQGLVEEKGFKNAFFEIFNDSCYFCLDNFSGKFDKDARIIYDIVNEAQNRILHANFGEVQDGNQQQDYR